LDQNNADREILGKSFVEGDEEFPSLRLYLLDEGEEKQDD